MFPRPTAEEYAALKEDIRINGQKVSIEMNQHGDILDGYTRFQICDELNRAPKLIVVPFESGLECRLYIYQKNALRRNLTEAQRVEIAFQAKPLLKKLAALRQKDGKPLGQNQPKGKVIEQMAAMAGVSPSTMLYYDKVKTNSPERYKEVAAGKVKVSRVYNEIVIKENKKLPKIPVPKGQYNLVVYDPSWPHDIEVAGGSGNSGNSQKYRPESIEEMCNHEMKNNLAKDCIFAIWTLPTFHSEVLQVIQAWGFEKIRVKMYWDKMITTMGFNFRNSVEELCICTRGKVKAFWLTDTPNIVHEKLDKKIHSRKPDIFYTILEKAAKNALSGSKLSKAELNATKERPGWTTIGNQISKYCKKCNGFHIGHNAGPDCCECDCHNHIVIELKFSTKGYSFELKQKKGPKLNRGGGGPIDYSWKARDKLIDQLLASIRNEYPDRTVISKVLKAPLSSIFRDKT